MKKFTKGCVECNIFFDIIIHEPINSDYDSVLDDSISSDEIEFCPICGSTAFEESEIDGELDI